MIDLPIHGSFSFYWQFLFSIIFYLLSASCSENKPARTSAKLHKAQFYVAAEWHGNPWWVAACCDWLQLWPGYTAMRLQTCGSIISWELTMVTYVDNGSSVQRSLELEFCFDAHGHGSSLHDLTCFNRCQLSAVIFYYYKPSILHRH